LNCDEEVGIALGSPRKYIGWPLRKYLQWEERRVDSCTLRNSNSEVYVEERNH
jgi:hypothetical protein